MPRKQKILVIEDERINRELLTIFLNKKYELIFADNLKTAILKIDLEPYQMIITDIRLGDKMDGIKVLKYARKSNLNNTIPIIAYTASDTSINQKSFADEGFNGFIAKPIIKNDFLQKIADLIVLKQIPKV